MSPHHVSPCMISSFDLEFWVTCLNLLKRLFIYEGHSISITELSISEFMEPWWNVNWSFTFDPGQEDMG